MSNLNSNTKGKNIWSLITVPQLAAAIASLGNQTNQLEHETWRLNVETSLPSSLWYQVIDKLEALDQSAPTRFKLYKIWRADRYNIHKLVEEKKRSFIRNENDGNDDNIAESENPTVLGRGNSVLFADPSLPLPQRPITRANQGENVNDDNNQNPVVSEISFVLTPSEWKAAFSRTHQKMNDDWTKIFSGKLTSSPGITCSYFWCRATCTNSNCTRSYFIILKNQVDVNTSALFLVRISGIENHNANIETMARPLRGEERFRVGKRANEIGPLAVFRERVEAADEGLLAAGNHTGCETIEAIKKTGADYRKKMQIDENIFTECRIITRAYRKEDVTSTHVQGYIHAKGEMPFRAHLFSQPQIERYIKYCMKEKYSYVHIDATGGVLKKMCEQKQSLLYAIIFKDGTDSNDTITLAHAILTDHTVPSITFFLGNVAYSIAEVKSKLILPSFFVIDFSSAIMNAILLAFNGENINVHLNRCWNVVCGKYNTVQLRSLSFIHFCCCHVIHAIARSLTAAHIDKKIRRGVLHIFAIILCGNDIKQLYDILGTVINIFGDPNEQNAKENFERMCSLQLDVDEESVTMLTNRKKIFKKAKKYNEELRCVDEYFRSSVPIIHQSPFNQEAIRLYPVLNSLINKKSKDDTIVNPLFSPPIVRIFYRWWAYLPLWTGLLWNFEERYSNNIEPNASIIYHPIRHSNAVIESYFRTLKNSILKNKVSNRPSEIIMELYRSVRVQFKAIKFNVTQSSKGRKRQKTTKSDLNEEEEWGKKGKGRTVYFNVIDKIASKRVQSKKNDTPSNDIIRKISESEDSTTVSSFSQSPSSSNESDDDTCSNQSSQSSHRQSISSSSGPKSVVSNKYSINIRNHSDKSTANDGEDKRSEVSIDYDFDNNMMSTITSTMYPVDNEPFLTTDKSSKKTHAQFSPQPEAIIDGQSLRWPKFGIENAFFEGQSYSLYLTCPIDSALFALYFLYRTDINIAGEFDDAPSTSSYSTLVRIFRLVEKEGWDAARISWLLHFHLLKTTDRHPKSLFGSVDEQVFCFIKNAQRYSTKVTCSRPDCTDRERNYSNTELDIFTSDTYIEKFEVETVGVCGAMVKRHDEITRVEALEKKYRDGKVPMINYQTNKNEYLNGWVCDATNIASEATFDDGYPPIIIANIKPLSRRSDEGYEANYVRLRDIKSVIRIGSVKYKLRAVIHHKSAHFTATLIGRDNTLYHYDDQTGVREEYSNLNELIYKEYFLKINTTTTTITTITTATHDIVEKAEQFKNQIDKYVTAIKIIFLSITGAIVTLTPMVYFLIKCYKNNCYCRLSWWKIKSPTEYARRREVVRQRGIALDYFVHQLQETSPTVYSIA